MCVCVYIPAEWVPRQCLERVRYMLPTALEYPSED